MFDTTARYTCPQFRGIALYFSGWLRPETCPECDGSGGVFMPYTPGDVFSDGEYVECDRCGGIGETRDNDGWCYVTMVGDDRKFPVEIDELTVIADDDYCGVCGQIGCTHDGRDAE